MSQTILLFFIFITSTWAIQNPTTRTNRSDENLTVSVDAGQIQITIPESSTHSCDLLYVHRESTQVGYTVSCYLRNECRYVYVGNGGVVGCVNSPNPAPGVQLTIVNTGTLADGDYVACFSRWGSWGEPSLVGQTFQVKNGVVTGVIIGDPHVTNIKGEKFNVLQTGNHTLVHMPQGAATENTLFDVTALVTRAENQNLNRCYESWIQKVWITGRWLEEIRMIEFYTVGDDEFNSPRTIRMRINNQPATSPENCSKQLAPFLFEVKRPKTHLVKPTRYHEEIVTRKAKVRVGLAVVEISWAYMLTKDGGNNHLNIATSHKKGEDIPIGGILGLDDHTWAASLPAECKKHKASKQKGQSSHSTMHSLML